MDPDDELDDEGASGPLLPPDDRLWRHPSELAFAGPVHAFTGAGQPPSAPRLRLRLPVNHTVTIALLSGLVGALLATGIVYATGAVPKHRVAVPALERDVDSSPVITIASTGTPVGFVAGAKYVRRSCVTLVARDAHGMRVATAVVFRSDGMAVTTAHSVSGAQTITATVDGGRQVGARLVAADRASDLAVVKLMGSGYEPAPLGSALDIEVGDQVVSVEPPASGQAVPADQGSVDALGLAIVATTGARIGDLLRVDTTSVPSTVGDPVVDDHGAVIAITTAVGPPGASVVYAMPVDLARSVAAQLLASGRVVPTWLGVEGDDLSASQSRFLGVGGGAVVRRVLANSPASAAGLKPGDTVVGIDGRAVTSMANLIMAIHAQPAGTRVDLDVDDIAPGSAVLQRSVTISLTPRPAGIG